MSLRDQRGEFGTIATLTVKVFGFAASEFEGTWRDKETNCGHVCILDDSKLENLGSCQFWVIINHFLIDIWQIFYIKIIIFFIIITFKLKF